MRKIGKAELVLAYELRNSNCRKKLIAEILGVTPGHLGAMILKAERDGLGSFK